MSKTIEFKNTLLITVIAVFFLVLLFPVFTQSSSPQSEKITFQSDQFEIVGKLQLPDGEGPHPAIIVVHGSGRGTRGYYRMMRSKFVSAGYAALIWDKPGFGKSQGEFNEGKTQIERAAILKRAISTLRQRTDIDPDRIGVWGVSQASYVIPMALQLDAEISFMILVGAGGENGVQQTAYFIGQQILCEGSTAEQAAEADSLAAGVMSAKTYEEYAAYGRVLQDRYPLVRDLDFMAGVLPEDRWKPKASDSEGYFDPMKIIEETSIPILAFYGELDKNVDPLQGTAAYRAALEKAGNKHSRVVLFLGVDHDMVPCKTGCMRERAKRSNWRPHHEYLDAMAKWLGEIGETSAGK